MTAVKARKKRGGQPGNINAFKHGFYSRHFSNEELKELDVYTEAGLNEEITLMRITAKRMMGLADQVTKIEDQVAILGAVGLAATRLAGLLKVRSIIGGDDEDEVAGAVSDALSEALKQWHRE